MYFPLKDEEKRATEPGMEAEEEPLLLHPCNDEPPEHLAFVVEKGADEAWVLPKCDSLGERDEKGDTSIRLLGLNRFQLVKDWREKLEQLQWLEEDIQERAEALQTAASGADYARKEAALQNKLKQLKRLRSPEREYLLMKHQFVDSFLAEFRDS